MKRYYYHGIESYYGTYGDTLELMLKILNEGLKTRKEVCKHKDDKFKHVCLYKKDEEVNYKDEKEFLSSARAGWIDRCFVFIIDPNIEAEKETKETNLVDEWRSIGDIPPSKIKGIALPFEQIKEYLEDDYNDEDTIKDKEKLQKLLPIITEYVLNMEMFLVDSDMPNFTDVLDESLNVEKNTTK